MRPEIKLIYIGILKFGFKNSEEVGIIGLINYIIKNNLKLEEDPKMQLNRNYVSGSSEWIWELEWWNHLLKERRGLVIYFDYNGCNYQKIFGPDSKDTQDGMINKYSDFLDQYKWLSGG